MSTPTPHQSRLSLQLRKRNHERTEDGLPPKKLTKQTQTTDLTTQKQKNVPAFGAPLLEERKVTKRGMETIKTQDDTPTKKRDTRQSTLQQFLASSTPVSEKGSPETVTETTAVVTIEEAPEDAATPVEQPITKVSSKEQSSSVMLSSPTASPTTESTDNIDTAEPSDSSLVLASLPSPSSTPNTDRKKVPEASPQDNAASVVHGKSLLVKLDKERINEERTTLDKLVSALDITLTFHAARNVAAFFHKIQPMLRNTTKKNVTISHLCQILYVAPELYKVDTKLLKEYGKDVEAHQVSIGDDWPMPLSGKLIQERKDLMTKRSGDYYDQHKEANASIPEKELPRLDKVVDKKKWLQNANLPDRVRSVLELQEKRKAAKEEKASQPRVAPVGTPKDRAKALMERLRNKQKK